MRPRRLALLIAIGAFLAWIGSAGAADAKTKWLCRPGHAPDPCVSSLSSLRTTVISPGGQTRIVDPKPARKPKIDCFYVYPTVSTQPGPNANLHIAPEETGIARDQASRFSQTCRVFAPMYRQITGQIPDFRTLKAAAKVAYSDVRNAWANYLAHFNRGRGVVLIGHSQGATALIKLIRERIDPRPKIRRRLVSAIVPGGNLIVGKRKSGDGDFRHIPPCRSSRQTGCAIAYSSFDEPVASTSRFGYPDVRGSFADAWGLPLRRPGVRVLCTNPASLAGGPGRLNTVLPSVPPTALTAGLWGAIWNGSRPTAATPWITPRDHYASRCTTSNGARVLMLSPIDGAQHLTQPVPGYGLHFLDTELALGNLTTLVKGEARSYLKHG